MVLMRTNNKDITNDRDEEDNKATLPLFCNNRSEEKVEDTEDAVDIGADAKGKQQRGGGGGNNIMPLSSSLLILGNDEV